MEKRREKEPQRITNRRGKREADRKRCTPGCRGEGAVAIVTVVEELTRLCR